jgi:signal transduction histidine kinase
MRGSVRVRVTVLAAGAFALTLLGAGLVLLRSLERVLVDDLQSAAASALEQRADTLFEAGVPAGLDVIDAAPGSFVRLDGEVAGGQPVVMMIRGDLPAGGLVVSGSTLPEGVRVSSGAAGPSAAALGIGSADASEFEVTTVDFGPFALSTASPLDEIRETIDATRTLLWVLCPVLVTLVGLLAWILAGRALRPVHAVTARVDEIGSHSLHERVPVPTSSDEVAELATTMNRMLDRLESASATSRRLVSDASHELRTPVTVMRTELDVADRIPSNDWAATSATLRAELDRLQDLVDDLLLLARGDERAFARQRVAMADVVRDVAARRRPVPVVVRTPADSARTYVTGDEAALRRGVDHLVTNAARHAAGRVEVSVTAAGDEVVVHVDDDGPGIPATQRETVVRRFVRLDEGRSRDRGGCGLGLAVSSDVAAAHGGRLALGDSPLGGLRASLVLPKISEPRTASERTVS